MDAKRLVAVEERMRNLSMPWLSSTVPQRFASKNQGRWLYMHRDSN